MSISSARGAILSSEKLARRLAQHVDVFAEPEIEALPGVGDHARSLARAPHYRAQTEGQATAARIDGAGLGQQPVERLAGGRAGEQIALHFLAAGEPQQHALLLGLDALGQQRQVERAAERHDRLHQRLAAGIAAERRDEAPVDLELVEIEALQIGQAGIAGAEIVERQPDAERLQRIEPRLGLVRIVDQHALGDFEHQPRRRDVVLGQHVGDELDQRRIAHLHRRQIDGHVEAGPAPGIGQRAAQHEFAEPSHQPGLLGHRRRTARRDRAAHRMGPAQQRFGADDAGAVGRHDRLVMHVERLVLERAPQLLFEEAAVVELDIHRRLEMRDAAALLLLGGAEREVGPAHQLVARLRVARRVSKPRRDADLHRLLVDPERPRQRARQRRHRGLGGIRVRARSSPRRIRRRRSGRRTRGPAACPAFARRARSADRRRCDGRARR